ncbi:MAG: hypothetical protein K8I29_19280 [Alphaproteobacteria bacterium]|uniref:Uncharacterized protein n=1 Tax=Candidatus Nitrobium versatile TaxID=2884831 RepID=A0A953M3K2_9BACT|nr:hypothetical protein [Candidatus Nitrobium versatile]
MIPYVKAYSIIFALTLSVVSIAHGAGDNPFIEEEKPRATVPPAGKGGPKGASGGFRPESLNEVLPFAQSQAPQPPAQMERKWKIRGKVNDMVVIRDEKGERIHVRNGEVFDGCLIEFPSALCERDAVIKTLQETIEREKKERIALSRTIDDLTRKNSEADNTLQQLRKERDILAQQHKEVQAAQEKSLKEIEDLAFQKDDMEHVLEQLRKEHEGVLVHLKEIQAALHEKEAAAAKATAEAVKNKTDALSLLEMTAQREQCSKEVEQIRNALKERETEAFGAGVLIEYVRKSGERVPTEEYGEIIVKEMSDSLIIGVSKLHADQAEQSFAKAARARIMQEQFIFYLLERGSVDFTSSPSGQPAHAAQRVAG